MNEDKKLICITLSDSEIELHNELAELEQERDRLRDAIQNYIDGNYKHPRSYRPNNCPHGQGYWEECEQCNLEHFQKALKET